MGFSPWCIRIFGKPKGSQPPGLNSLQVSRRVMRSSTRVINSSRHEMFLPGLCFEMPSRALLNLLCVQRFQSMFTTRSTPLSAPTSTSRSFALLQVASSAGGALPGGLQLMDGDKMISTMNKKPGFLHVLQARWQQLHSTSVASMWAMFSCTLSPAQGCDYNDYKHSGTRLILC